MTEKICCDIPGYGEVTVTCAALDVAIARYLPASPHGLRQIIDDRSGIPLSVGTPMSALLCILADFDHNVDNSPLRSYQ